ncbi:hypothetical protein ACFCYM_30520 [Streptomyces sp. NPDC056254]|uniref:hypothetical protein n=1 Tax=Streptomyces sp. NPDC056254 TaxID=3345763 RepID=UPI0035DA38AE
MPEVVRVFDLTETAVGLWLAQADESHLHKDLERDERAELAELRRENRRLREVIDGRPVHRGGEAGRSQRRAGV